MKTVFTAPLLLLWLFAGQAVVASDWWPEFNRHGRRLNKGCSWDNIEQTCGHVEIPTADPDTYPTRSFRECQRELITPIEKYLYCLEHNPQCEGKDNPDIAVPWAIVHYICTHWKFKNFAQVEMYDCMVNQVGCVELPDRVPRLCEGFNDGGPTSDTAEGDSDPDDIDDEGPDKLTKDTKMNALNKGADRDWKHDGEIQKQVMNKKLTKSGGN